MGDNRNLHQHHNCHHHHHHAATEAGMKWAFFLNLGFSILELVGGLMVNSMAILSDALHDFGDALAIGLAYFLEKKSYRDGNAAYSYGYRRLSTVSAVVTAIVLIAGSLLIIAQSLPRLLTPEMPNLEGMLGLAVVGVGVNFVAFIKMSKGQGLNSKALRWHFIEDIFGWIVVLIAALVMMVWPIPALDAAMGIILAVWVMWNVYKILLQALRVFLQATPVGLSTDAVIEQILKISSVKDVHHLHIWTMDGESHILTCHVTLNSDMKLDQIAELKREIKQGLLESFNISEATLEFEWSNETCQDPEHIVR